MVRLILASSSPRRRQLLEDAGYTFDAVAPDVDESQRRDEEPYDYALRIAVEKALRVVKDNFVTVGADTVVVYATQAMGKPRDEIQATEMLEVLGGGAHRVMTGWALATPNGIVSSSVEITNVVFRELSADEIQDYVQSGEPLDRAGAYAIQGGASGFVAAIDGSYTNVMGLPMEALTVALADAGISPAPGSAP